MCISPENAHVKDVKIPLNVLNLIYFTPQASYAGLSSHILNLLFLGLHFPGKMTISYNIIYLSSSRKCIHPSPYKDD